MPEVIFLSDILGKPVKGTAGETVGRLKDLVVHMQDDRFPPLSGLVVAVEGKARHRFYVSARQVVQLSNDDVHLGTSMVDLRPFIRRDGEALLNKDVLDKQIIDINGRRVIRVNDVTLSYANGSWRLAGADVSAAALLHRLGAHRFAARLQREVIPWDAVQFFATEVPGAKIQLKYDKLARLHPMDIAELINELGYQQGSEVIAALDDALAADTVEGMAPELQSALISAMDVEEAADILDEMAPDDAADLLADLPKEQAQDLLEAMEVDEAAEVKRLLEYPENTAGGLMTTEYVAVPQDLTVEQIIERMRSYEWLPDIIYYVYIVDSEENGKLLGVVTLRDLLMADRNAPITAIMRKDLITGHVRDDPEEVARTIAHYNLIALPILDDTGRLCGIVTVDDAMDIILPEDWKQRMPRVFS